MVRKKGHIFFLEASDNERSGFTLTEMAIVLGIIGFLLSAIWIAASAVYTNFRSSTANTELTQIAQAARTFFSAQMSSGDGSQDLTPLLFVTKSIPPAMFDGSANEATPATVIAHAPWTDSTLKVYSDTYATAGDAFQIVFVNVPAVACVRLATSNTGNSRDVNMTGIGFAQTTTGNAIATGSMYTTFPITAATALLECGTGRPDIGFQFTLH